MGITKIGSDYNVNSYSIEKCLYYIVLLNIIASYSNSSDLLNRLNFSQYVVLKFLICYFAFLINET